MYVYTYIFIYICINTHTHTLIHTDIFILLHVTLSFLIKTSLAMHACLEQKMKTKLM